MLQRHNIILGLDIGDRYSHACILDRATGHVLEETEFRTTPIGVEKFLKNRAPADVALEVGSHSPWVSRILESSGHNVTIANPRNVSLIHSSSRKNDRLDAERLARLARLDVTLLSPINHRSVEAQADLARLRSRDALVQTRSRLVVHVRGSVKSFGARIPAGSPEGFPQRAREHMPAELIAALEPVLGTIEHLNEAITRIESELATLAKEKYPVTQHLQSVVGVGLITSFAFILTLEDPNRFSKSRESHRTGDCESIRTWALLTRNVGFQLAAPPLNQKPYSTKPAAQA